MTRGPEESRLPVPSPPPETPAAAPPRDAAEPSREPPGRVEQRPHQAAGELDDRRLFANRELGLLRFQRRVLEEAADPANPLLERLKFVSIVASNLDEFFMIRVAGLQQQTAAGVTRRSDDGLTPAEQLEAVRAETLALSRELRDLLADDLLPRLAGAGVHLLDWAALDEGQRARALATFDDTVFPVLTPLALDPGRPFPHISNLSLNLAVLIEDGDGAERFARVKVPDTLPRLVPVGPPAGGAAPGSHHFVWLEQLIAASLDRLFPGVRVLEVHPFHVTRDAEMALQEMEAADLLESVEQGVRQRRFGLVVRLKVAAGIPPRVRDLLVDNLAVDPRDVQALEPPIGLARVAAGLGGVDRPDLRYPGFTPVVPARLQRDEEEGDLFAAVRRHDVLLHHPFDSFGPVLEFLRTAARDPDVLAIKQTLYRVGHNAPVVEALLEASQNGKQVAVLVELKARFDEESNIGWARALEAEGVHVIYGLLGLKTHSKVALVVRREGAQLRRYVHLSTGNYNTVTAGLYTDLGFFTCDREIGDDATHLFNYLTGYTREHHYRRLLVAPINMRRRFLELIEREAEHQRAGRGGHLVFKMNALVDPELIRALSRASQAGVRVDLLVRGVCCLRPGVPGLTEGVRVTSVVGRFLEHSRVFWFRNGGAEEVYLGSADLMQRNLDRRVEVLFPVTDPALVRHLRDDVLETYRRDNVRSRLMLPDGGYRRLRPAEGEAPVDAQAALLAARAGRRG